MHSYFALKTFRYWLKKNRSRFRHPPYIAHIRKEGFYVRFTGISQHIMGFIEKHGSAGIWIHYDGRCWDSLSEFDVAPEKSPEGRYFCRFCKTPQLFASRQALLIEHSWEPLIEWVNTRLTSTKWVCLYGGENAGMTAAKLKQKHEVERERDRDRFFVTAFPVFKSLMHGNWQPTDSEI